MTVSFLGEGPAVQDAWPSLTCYGCGPANPDGLHLKSYPGEAGDLVATFVADETHTAGVADAVYGGLLASLVDCNSIWAAMVAASRVAGRPLAPPPSSRAGTRSHDSNSGALAVDRYVTGRLAVEYRRPTPLGTPVTLRSWVEGPVGRRTRVLSELVAGNTVTATGDVLAVRVDDARRSSAATREP